MRDCRLASQLHSMLANSWKGPAVSEVFGPQISFSSATAYAAKQAKKPTACRMRDGALQLVYQGVHVRLIPLNRKNPVIMGPSRQIVKVGHLSSGNRFFLNCIYFAHPGMREFGKPFGGADGALSAKSETSSKQNQ